MKQCGIITGIKDKICNEITSRCILIPNSRQQLEDVSVIKKNTSRSAPGWAIIIHPSFNRDSTQGCYSNHRPILGAFAPIDPKMKRVQTRGGWFTAEFPYSDRYRTASYGHGLAEYLIHGGKESVKKFIFFFFCRKRDLSEKKNNATYGLTSLTIVPFFFF